MLHYIVLGILLIAFGAIAQTDANCTACWTVTDERCSEGTDCSDWSGAETLTFTAGCTGTHYFNCKTVCPSDSSYCVNCITCSRLIEVSEKAVIATCITSLDPFGGCESLCHDEHNVQLVQGAQYRIEVTMQRCRDIPNCSYCEICTAKARVYYPGSTCTAW